MKKVVLQVCFLSQKETVCCFWYCLDLNYQLFSKNANFLPQFQAFEQITTPIQSQFIRIRFIRGLVGTHCSDKSRDRCIDLPAVYQISGKIQAQKYKGSNLFQQQIEKHFNISGLKSYYFLPKPQTKSNTEPTKITTSITVNDSLERGRTWKLM